MDQQTCRYCPRRQVRVLLTVFQRLIVQIASDSESDTDTEEEAEEEGDDDADSEVVFDKKSIRYFEIPASHIELVPVRGKGMGVRALRALRKGGYIVYRGRMVRTTQLGDISNKQYITTLPNHHPLHKTHALDGNPKHTPTDGVCLGCYCNDSRRNPTSFLTYLSSKKVVVVALGRNIRKGTEITFDYGKSYPRTWT